MPDLDQRLHGLDRVRPPELWERIERHEPRRTLPDHDGQGPSRLLVAVLAFLVAAAGIAVAIRAFSHQPPAPPVNPSPAPAVPGSLITFVTQSADDAVPIIAVMRSDGTGIHRLIAGTDPTWSPDGSQIALSCGSPLAICVMDEDGTHLRRITDPPAEGFDDAPSWSVAGIAFTRTYSTKTGPRPRDVFTVEPDGTALRPITGDPSDDFDPTWSPDGRRLAYVRVPMPRPVNLPSLVRPEDIEQIWVMDANGANAVRLTTEASGAVRPAWSPDGSFIAFDEDSSIFVMNPDGTGIRQLAPGTTGKTPDGLGAVAAWSSDSTRIVFTCGDPDTDHDICVMNADGTGRRQLTTGPENEVSPAWQPTAQTPQPTPKASPTASGSSSLPPAGKVIGTIPYSPTETELFTVLDGSLFVALTGPGEPAHAFHLERIEPNEAPIEYQVPFDLREYLSDMTASSDGVYIGTSVIKRFTDAQDQLLRLDPHTGDVLATASFDGRVMPLAAGGDLRASLGDGRVVRLDPGTLAVLGERRLVPAGAALSNSADLSTPAFGLGSLWLLVWQGNAPELVRLDPISLDVLSRTPLPTPTEQNEFGRVIGDEDHVYIVGSEIQPVDANGALVGAPIVIPGLQAAEIHGDGLVGITYSDASQTSALVLFEPDGTIVGQLDLVDGGGDLVVEGDDAWFMGDAGQGYGIVHVRLAGAQPASPTTPRPSISVLPQQGLPEQVAATRGRIITAAELGDYELLRDVLNPSVFLSDYGFGVDPIDDWQAIGLEPLEKMAALLQMPFVVKETNEGTLYQWPRFGPDSTADDLTGEERQVLSTAFTDQEIESMFTAPGEGGYMGPNLGILADGTWWFFRLEFGL